MKHLHDISRHRQVCIINHKGMRKMLALHLILNACILLSLALTH